MAIGSKGVDGALAFCNEKAYPIASIHADNAVIRRATVRYRNPNNKSVALS
jgi:hypothetical protein